MKKSAALYVGVAAIAIAATFVSLSPQSSAQQAPPGVSIGDSDLGGVVTSTKGPEAGVWVVAETRDLPTKFIKIVVTDDQGRYVLPELPKANYDVWVRGYGLVDSAKVQSAPGKILESLRGRGSERKRRRRILSGAILVLDARDSREEPVPRHRAERQRHAGSHQEPGAMDCNAQDARLQLVPPGRQQGDASHLQGSRQLRYELCGVDAPGAGRPGRRKHGAWRQRSRHAARAEEFRQLDRPDRQRRAAEVEAVSPAGGRAQRGCVDVGLGRRQDLSA